jgi:hypothetical protein
VGASLYLCISGLTLFYKSGFLRYLLSCLALLFFIVSIASIISFVSIYIYELPTHHCPFDILQGWYNYIGYPIYISLFLAIYFGILPGLFQSFKSYSGVGKVIVKAEKSWVYWCLGSTLCFLTLVTYAVATSNLNYFSK